MKGRRQGLDHQRLRQTGNAHQQGVRAGQGTQEQLVNDFVLADHNFMQAGADRTHPIREHFQTLLRFPHLDHIDRHALLLLEG